MDYKEKYNAALERARYYHSKDYMLINSAIENIFPELAESKDEKMKKAIMHILYENYTDAAVIEGVEIAEIVTWLEKQGEQKQTWEPDAAQLIVIKDLIEDKSTSKVNKVILRGMLDEFKQFTDTRKMEIEKQGENKQEPVQKPFDYEHATIHQKDFAPKDEPKSNFEIPFGANDSELQEVDYYIPKGFHAEIKDDRVVIKKVGPKFHKGQWITIKQ